MRIYAQNPKPVIHPDMKDMTTSRSFKAFRLIPCFLYIIFIGAILSGIYNSQIPIDSSLGFGFYTYRYSLIAILAFWVVGSAGWFDEDSSISRKHQKYRFTLQGLLAILIFFGAFALLAARDSSTNGLDTYLLLTAAYIGTIVAALHWRYHLYYVALTKEPLDIEDLGIDG